MPTGRFAFALAAAIGLQGVGAAHPAELTKEAGVRVQWRSENKDERDLATALERLYVVLFNTGNLPVREAKEPGQPVETMLRSEQLFFGSFFPIGVDAVMCDLNPSVCERERPAVPEKEIAGIAEHVGGYVKTPGKWRNHEKSVVMVPDLAFEEYTALASFDLAAIGDIDAFVGTLQADCSQWKISCPELIKGLNVALFDTKRGQSGKPEAVILPASGVTAEIVLTGVENSETLRSVQGLNLSYETEKELPADRRSGFAGIWQKFIATAAPADLVTDALADNISSFGAAAAQTGFDDAQFAEQSSLLALIHHPFSRAGDVPDELKRPIPIAVYDFLFDKEHCELKDRIIVDEELLAAPPSPDRPDAAECGEIMATPPLEAFDHGTHVAGLIAAEANDKGVVGLNPFAKLTYVALDPVALQDAAYRNRVAMKMVQGISPVAPIKVANLSWRYINQVGNNDLISQTIEQLKQSTLFVVAVGNERQAREGDLCGDYPACMRDKDNVIAVVGLDRSENPPRLWESGETVGSNWGNRFGIGAIASDVLSTTYRNSTGRMSGTSQAAPQVTAAASLIHSKFETHFTVDQPVLLPVEVKNRLIYTSDLFNELLTKVRGGRLNVDRALDMARYHVAVDVDGAVEEYEGTISRFGDFAEGQPPFITCERNDGALEDVRFKDLRRMFFDEDRRKYIVFYDKPSALGVTLERITDCDLKTRSHKAVIEADPDGEEVTFEFRDIRDYISPMF